MKTLVMIAAVVALMMTGCNDAAVTTATPTQVAEPQKVLVILKPYPVEVCNSKIETNKTSK